MVVSNYFRIGDKKSGINSVLPAKPLFKEMICMTKEEDYLTPAAKKPQMTITNGSIFPNKKNVAGNSVDKHKDLEEANTIISGDEIRQQNENL